MGALSMTETTLLSHILLDLGFFSALGTSEHPGMMKEEVYVKRGTPNTCDDNNGVTVVYDEEGRPWIIRNSRITPEMQAVLRAYTLERGAHVPHSNDGGWFIREVVGKF